MSNFSNVFDIRELCTSDEVRSGEDVIRAMFNCSDSVGFITVRNYSADSVDMAPDGESQYLIHWGGYQLNPETDEYDLAPYDLEEFRDFLETLKQASTLWNAEEEPPFSETLLAALRCFSKTFLRPIIVPFSDTDEAYVNCEAERRVGTGPMAYDFLRHCQRYCKLLSIPVPAAVLRGEEKRLAFAYIIHNSSTPVRIRGAEEVADEIL